MKNVIANDFSSAVVNIIIINYIIITFFFSSFFFYDDDYSPFAALFFSRHLRQLGLAHFFLSSFFSMHEKSCLLVNFKMTKDKKVTLGSESLLNVYTYNIYASPAHLPLAGTSPDTSGKYTVEVKKSKIFFNNIGII